MRVLMLGWEFPPHISGGLGTACEGLTTAMSGLGMEIDFILPKAIGVARFGLVRCGVAPDHQKIERVGAEMS